MPTKPKAELSVTINEALKILNEAVKRDPDAIKELINARVPCNEVLADHPTIQVAALNDNHFYGGTVTRYEVGLLGILNGIFSIDQNGCGYIASETDDSGNLIGFKLLGEEDVK